MYVQEKNLLRMDFSTMQCFRHPRGGLGIHPCWIRGMTIYMMVKQPEEGIQHHTAPETLLLLCKSKRAISLDHILWTTFLFLLKYLNFTIDRNLQIDFKSLMAFIINSYNSYT